jgi:hypothetical protein
VNPRALIEMLAGLIGIETSVCYWAKSWIAACGGSCGGVSATGRPQPSQDSRRLSGLREPIKDIEIRGVAAKYRRTFASGNTGRTRRAVL